MITRTFTISKPIIMTVVGNSVENQTVTLSGKLSTAECDKFLRKNPALVNGIYVQTTSVTYEDKLYGLDEQTFLKYAVELDDKRKPING